MKRLLFLFAFFGLLVMSAFAQAPQAFKYQAIARDHDGNILTNQQISVEIKLIQGSNRGVAVYSEQHFTTTNDFGLINLTIGQGVERTGDFINIDWGSDSYLVEISLDKSGGTDFEVMGTAQLLSVPYALYAEESGSDSRENDLDWGKRLNDKLDVYTGTGNGYPDGNVGIGTFIPKAKLEVAYQYGFGSSFMRVNNAPAGNPIFMLRRARGNINLKTAAQNGDNIGQIVFEAYEGANFKRAAAISSRIEGPVSPGIVSASLRFHTRDTLGVMSTKMRIHNDGLVDVLGYFQVEDGTSVNEISTDSTLFDESHDAVVTEGAIKWYVDNKLLGDGLLWNNVLIRFDSVNKKLINSTVFDYDTHVHVHNDLIVDGDMDVAGTVDLSAPGLNTNVRGNLNVAQKATFNSTVDVIDSTRLHGTLEVHGITKFYHSQESNNKDEGAVILENGGLGVEKNITSGQDIWAYHRLISGNTITIDGTLNPGSIEESNGKITFVDDTIHTDGAIGVGTLFPKADIHVTNDNGVIAEGTLGLGTLGVEGAGVRMLWYPRKAAFRAGLASATSWNASNIGNYSAAMGYGTTASGDCSMAFGQGTKATGTHSVAMGFATTANGDFSTAFGCNATTTDQLGFAVGLSTIAGYSSFSGGTYSEASGMTSFAYGGVVRAIGNFSVAFGYESNASGDYSFAHGYQSNASGDYSFARGYQTNATGDYSFAHGYQTKTTANGAVAFGYKTEAADINAFAMGESTTSSGESAFAIGIQSAATSQCAFAAGYQDTASGIRSAAFGIKTKAESYGDFAIGRFNVGGGDPTGWVDADPVFEIGIGASAASPVNAMTVYKNGSATMMGPVTITDTTESTSSLTGALIVAGGIGAGKNINAGGIVASGATITMDGTYNTTTWASTLDDSDFNRIHFMTDTLTTLGWLGIGTTQPGAGIDNDYATLLDQTTIHTNDGAFNVYGNKGIFFTVADSILLVAQDYSKFVTDDTLELCGQAATIICDDGMMTTIRGNLTLKGYGFFEDLLDVDGHTTLDQVSINTSDGEFSVSGPNNVNFDVTGAIILKADDPSEFTCLEQLTLGGDTVVVNGVVMTSKTDVGSAYNDAPFMVKGGAGFWQNVYMDKALNVSGPFQAQSITSITSLSGQSLLVNNGQVNTTLFVNGSSDITIGLFSTGTFFVPTGGVSIGGSLQVKGGLYGQLGGTLDCLRAYIDTIQLCGTDPLRVIGSAGVVIESTAASTSTTTGALVVAGGTGIGGDLWVGGDIHGNISGNLKLDSSPANSSSSGTIAEGVIDTGVSPVFGSALFVASDGEYELADADAVTTMPCIALALGTGTGTQDLLFHGFITNSSWSWTVGGEIYVSTTAGGLTQTAPSGSGDVVQILGVATSATTFLFDPDLTTVTIAP